MAEKTAAAAPETTAIDPSAAAASLDTAAGAAAAAAAMAPPTPAATSQKAQSLVIYQPGRLVEKTSALRFHMVRALSAFLESHERPERARSDTTPRRSFIFLVQNASATAPAASATASANPFVSEERPLRQRLKVVARPLVGQQVEAQLVGVELEKKTRLPSCRVAATVTATEPADDAAESAACCNNAAEKGPRREEAQQG